MIDNSYFVHMLAQHRMQSLARPHDALPRSGPGIRRRLARGLRKLADWLEPAFQVTVPEPRHPT